MNVKQQTEASAMAMMQRMFVRFAAAALMALALSACNRSESYRYKLTLAVNTPDGVKRGSTVAEVLFREFSFPEKGTMTKLRGEALYVDLGPGARPLIVLLTNHLRPKYGKDIRWTRGGGPMPQLICRIYGIAPSVDYMDDVPRIARLRGPREITPDDLPDLVTFVDINNPNTVMEVDPNNLPAALGPGVSWNEITLESTDESITTGIKANLPWIPAYYQGMLDGHRYHDSNTLANKLSTADFDKSDD